MPKGLWLTAGLLLSAAGLFGVISGNSAQPSKPSATVANSSVIGSVCSESGATLVVDFGQESELVSQATCVSDFEGNGWELLEAAGFTPEGTKQYPNAFVCRIGQWPKASAQDCLDTPSYQDGTWVYFKALDGAWVRSGQGAADPANLVTCGSVEGWVFITPETSETGQKPSVVPPKVTCDSE